jgi:hypothetical protein
MLIEFVQFIIVSVSAGDDGQESVKLCHFDIEAVPTNVVAFAYETF